MPKEPLRKRAHQFFGLGGKLFITDATDGSPRSLRTLVQADGEIVTRATAATIGDPELIKQHELVIHEWFDRLGDDWARAERWLSVGVYGVGTAFAVGDLQQLILEHSAVHPWMLVPVVAVPVRSAITHYARRRLLRAMS